MSDDDHWRSTALPDDLDADKLAEAALAILLLSRHGERVVWKGMEFHLMNLLHEKGWITDPVSKTKSVHLTEEGFELAQKFQKKLFGREAGADGGS